MTAFVTKPDAAVTTFMWLTKNKRKIHPADMKTPHIFNTLKMIWNHAVPEPYKFRPFTEYKFGRAYTPRYMSEAVQALMAELRRRKDLTEDMKQHLDEMGRRAVQVYNQDRICGLIRKIKENRHERKRISQSDNGIV